MEIAEFEDPTPTVAYHKAFMSATPPSFLGNEGPDKAEEWIKETKKAFDIQEVPERLKVKFGAYRLVGDAKAWWSTLHKTKYRSIDLTLTEFGE